MRAEGLNQTTGRGSCAVAVRANCPAQSLQARISCFSLAVPVIQLSPAHFRSRSGNNGIGPKAGTIPAQ
jgi:hypothetical protein